MTLRSAHIVALVVLALAACRNRNTVEAPNRVLDRPTDLVLACAKRVADVVGMVGVGDCDASSGSQTCTDEDTPYLLGFTVNSERNEVAMFRKCARYALVDMDSEAPGYQFIPVGTMPTHMAATGNSCRVLSSNIGSCDLSSIYVPEAARYALGREPLLAPGTLTTTVVPQHADGTPLAAAPGVLVAPPKRLSLDPGLPLGDTDSEGLEPPDPTEADPTEGEPLVELCGLDDRGSVYVTFPACQLIAEVSLSTQQILQSRRLVRGADGEFELVDAGVEPTCPVECPDLLEPGDDTVDHEGYFPVALELVQARADTGFDFDALLVGGRGSDVVFEIRFDSAGGWGPASTTRRLELENPAGVSALRATPVLLAPDLVPLDAIEAAPGGGGGGVRDAERQFVYAVGGDGTTRVIDRNNEDIPDDLGVECDTQVQPNEAFDEICHPVDPDAAGIDPARRPFAVGPGIRAPFGASITDWAFFTTPLPQATGMSPDPPDASVVPSLTPGLFGVGSTTSGRLVISTFGQFRGEIRRADDVGTMDTTVFPHSLWPRDAPALSNLPTLPRLKNEVSTRSVVGNLRDAQVLAPSLRRIDYAYALPPGDPDEIDDDRKDLAAKLGGFLNVDGLGADDEPGSENGKVYSHPVVRAVAHDYEQWQAGTWELVWEGGVPGTNSATGQIRCNDPEQAPFCDFGSADEEQADPSAILVDEGASFCDDGVLAGDKVVIFGCRDHGDCGLGQACLTAAGSGANSTGICVSQQAWDDVDQRSRLQTACAAYISAPCRPPFGENREYLIRRAYQDRLVLWPMDVSATTIVRKVPVDDGSGDTDGERYDPERRLLSHPYYEAACAGVDPGQLCEIEGKFTCELPDGAAQPDGGCDSDLDCFGYEPGDAQRYVCMDGACQRPCERGVDPDSCFLLSPVPGEACFREFVHYEIRARNSFLVRGPGRADYISDQIVEDRETGECVVDPTISSLLNSRIWLGEDEVALRAGVPACTSTTPSARDPNPCVIGLDRRLQPASLFHYLRYDDAPITALRFANPVLSMVLDLTSAVDVATPIVYRDEEIGWPTSFAPFRRSRIPPGYRERFTTELGYTPAVLELAIKNLGLVYPIRIVAAPSSGAPMFFVVDAGGFGGTTGVRGQVMLARIEGLQGIPDDAFLVR